VLGRMLVVVLNPLCPVRSSLLLYCIYFLLFCFRINYLSISQLVIQDKTCTHNFDSESEQQSMQWNERIDQNCHFHYTA